jgi:hypothetical protein
MKNSFIYYSVTGILIIVLLFFLFKQYWYVDDFTNPDILKIKEKFKRMGLKYVPLQLGSSTYTQNKSFINLCTKHPKTGETYDENTLFYVALHEYAHILNSGIGHDDGFKRIFSELMKKATLLNLLNPELEIPLNYCGIDE